MAPEAGEKRLADLWLIFISRKLGRSAGLQTDSHAGVSVHNFVACISF